MILVEIPMRLGPGGNARDEHWRVRHRRVKNERQSIAWALVGKVKPPVPVTLLITRIAPSEGLDEGDNLSMACKAVRDEIAKWIGVDDKLSQIALECKNERQEQGVWGVRVEVVA